MLRKLSFVVLTFALLDVAFLTGQQKPPEAQTGRDLVLNRGAEGRRLALVIGIDNYPRAPLLNARNDARAMTAALRELGFDVTTLENATRDQIVAGVARFGEGLRPADVAWFFFAGHGLQVGGENYLVPMDFAGTSQTEVRLTTLPVSELQNAFSRAQISIVVLDACRNNPFLAARGAGSGLAPMEARGNLIAFATGAGQVASDNDASGNGLFTQELLRVIGEPDLTIRDMFFRVRQRVLDQSGGRQFPAVYDGLVGDFALRRSAATVAGADRPSVPEQQTPPAPVAPQPAATKSGGGATKWLFLGGGAAAAAGAAVALGGGGGSGSSGAQSSPAVNGAPSITSVSVTPTGTLLAHGTVATFEVVASDPDGDPLTAVWSVGPPTPASLAAGRASVRVRFIHPNPASVTPTVTVSDGKASVTGNYGVIALANVTGLWTGRLGQANCSPASSTCFTLRLSLSQNASAVTGDFEDQFGRTGRVTGTVLEERALQFSVSVGSHPVAGPGGAIDFSLTADGSVATFAGTSGASLVTISR